MKQQHDGELAGEAGERLEAEAPDEYLRRRDFLQRTALTAGLGIGRPLSSTGRHARGRGRAQAAHRAAASLPAPRNMPIDTFVVLMMENRSFDHYLGWLPNADGRQAGLTYTDKTGAKLKTQPPRARLAGLRAPRPRPLLGRRAHAAQRRQDGRLPALGRQRRLLDLLLRRRTTSASSGHAAQAFTTFDHFHCSLMGSTLPNREYMHAAQSYGMTRQHAAHRDELQAGFPDTTIFAALDAGGRLQPLLLQRRARVGAVGRARARALGPGARSTTRAARRGTLPAVSYVDPNFGGSVGRGPRPRGDEHPHGDVRAGQAFMADVVHAFMESPQWKRGALFIVYDEWGGFFDHVRPPRVPDIRNDLEHQRRLRPDGHAHPGDRGLAVGAARSREPHDLRVRVDLSR